MMTSRRRHGLLLGLTALLTLGLDQQSHATYTKLYRFYNQTGAAQGYVRATTVGLEIVPTATQYASPTAWAPGTTAQLVVTGVPSTTLTFGIRSGVSSGVTVANGAMAQTGWRTSDNTCRLRDLRWVSAAGAAGAAVSPTQDEGVQGGGYLIRDGGGELVWVITNDTGLPLDLSTAEFDVIAAAPPVGSGAVSALASGGGDPSVVAVRLHGLNAGLSGLCSAIAQARTAGRINATTASSLTAPLSLAARFTPVALRAYAGGKLTVALANWADVAGKVRLFLDKLAQLQAAGMVPSALYNQWSATGVEVWGGLRALPRGPNSVNPATLPAPSVAPPPPAPTEPPLTYTLWPLPGGILPPGQYTAFVVPSLPADVPTLVLHALEVQDGQILLEWEEQVTVTDDLEPPGPELTPPPDYYDGSGIGHYRSDPGTVTLSSPAADVARVYWGFVSGDEGDEFALLSAAPGAAFALQTPQRLIYAAQDLTGNLSHTKVAVVDELRVDATWTGPGNCGGGQWGISAFSTIQSAINAAQSGYTVRVAAGTYIERINFLGKAITVRSANPLDPAVVAATVINGNTGGTVVTFNHAEKSTSVLSGFTIRNGRAATAGGIYCTSASPTIQYNVITANMATPVYPDPGAGGIYLYGSSPRIADNTISANSTTRSGGGIGCYQSSSASIEHNVFTQNRSTAPSNVLSWEGGGGIYCTKSSPQIRNNSFSSNVAWNNGGAINSFAQAAPIIESNTFTSNWAGMYGGGVSCTDNSPASNVTVRSNTFTSNTAKNQGGGLYLSCWKSTVSSNVFSSNTTTGSAVGAGGGAIWVASDSLSAGSSTITGNTISANHIASGEGGGIHVYRGSSVTVRDNTITGNAGGYGGGIYAEGGLIERNTLTGNSGAYGGALYLEVSYTVQNNLIFNNTSTYGAVLFDRAGMSGATAIFRNNTISHNKMNSGGTCSGVSWSNSTATLRSCTIAFGTGPGIYRPTGDGGSAPVLRYCDVYGNTGGNYSNTPNQTGSNGNISVDPLFASLTDYHLTSGSPCVDTGDPDGSGLSTTDLDGNQRIWNGTVDMGAYEFGSSPPGAGAAALVLTSAAAVATAGGAQIVFTLSRDADVTVNVLNMAGRPIKMVVADRTYPKGSSTLLWNCFSDRGTKVPSGSYLVQITGRAADGQQVSRVCPVRVRR